MELKYLALNGMSPPAVSCGLTSTVLHKLLLLGLSELILEVFPVLTACQVKTRRELPLIIKLNLHTLSVSVDDVFFPQRVPL